MGYKLYGSMCHVVNDTNINGTEQAKDAILLMIGGETERNYGSSNILEYNISFDKWTEIGINGTLTQSRSFTKSIYDQKNNFIWIVGGGSSSNDSFLNTTDIFYVSNYSVQAAFDDTLPNKLEFNTVSRHKDNLFVWGGYSLLTINGSNGSNHSQQTKGNLNKIFVFNIPDNKDSNKTLYSIGIVIGGCVFMLICGCSAYCLCARRKTQDESGINYNRQ